ncbi:MAG: SIS domain-containing protein [Caldilineaceae bacterium]|nr:SIS domain-containing protein [Caldilineaceae bacterium]
METTYPYQWRDNQAYPIQPMLDELCRHRAAGRKIVTTNGCFDLLHAGHVQFLHRARAQGDLLVVALNSDKSVHALKGSGRPILAETDRATMLAALRAVDYVVIFDDLLPNLTLEQIKPHVHVKAADYDARQLPEAEIVEQNHGRVSILPLVGGYSTSQLVERIVASAKAPLDATNGEQDAHDKRSQIIQQLLTGSNLLRQTAYRLDTQILMATEKVLAALRNDHKILLCGNGGSAADAQHIAAEFVGRFRRERRALAAIALTTDSSILTSVSNDYGFEQIFARQIDGLGQPGDVLIAISTSGTSPNVLAGAQAARERQIYVIALTGSRSSPLGQLADVCLQVPSVITAQVQQAHMAILHTVCDIVEGEFVREEA